MTDARFARLRTKALGEWLLIRVRLPILMGLMLGDEAVRDFFEVVD